VVDDLIREWNLHHGDSHKARVELMNWRTHAHPEVGRRPQALINRQFADRADVVLAIFWRRLGSPTGKAESGTVEEIDRAIRRRKKVMVYFSQRPSDKKEPPDPKQQAKMERFKQKLGRNGIYATFGDMKEFEIAVRRGLSAVMGEVVEAARTKE